MRELEAWASEKGLSLSGAAVTPRSVPFPVQDQGPAWNPLDWGLFAARDIGSSDEILKVPELLTLRPSLAAGLGLGQICDGLRPWVCLALTLILEHSKGPSSDFAPYIASLPSEAQLNAPLLWSEAELAELEGTQVLGSVLQYKDLVASEYELVQERIQLSGSSPFPPGTLSLDSFTWAFAVLRSRCFPPCTQDGIALVPFLDLVNHGHTPPSAAWQRTSTGGGLFSGVGWGGGGGNKASGACISMVAGRPYKAGEQVFLEYGADLSNGELLLDFGFVEPLETPPATSATINATPEGESPRGWPSSSQQPVIAKGLIGGAARGSPEAAAAAARALSEAAGPTDSEKGSARRQVYSITLDIPEGDRFCDDKLDIAEINGLPSPVTFDLRLSQPCPDTLHSFLRLTALSGPDAFLLEALFRNDVWGHVQFPVSRENEEAVCTAMIDGCSGALAAYPTSLDDDLALLQSGTLDSSGRKYLAVVVRIGEKRVLLRVLSEFEQRLRALDNLEYYAERRLRDLGLLDDQGDMTPWVSAE